MSIKKDEVKELCNTYFNDERVLKRVIKRLNEDTICPTELSQVDHYLDSIIYALEKLLIDRQNLEFTDLKWGTFIGNAVENIRLLLHLE